MLLRNSYLISAAHHLPRHAGACRRPHGHNYTIDIEVRGDVDAVSGMVIDFADLDKLVWQHALDRLDHSNLNEIMDNPTAEHIALWIWRQLKAPLPGLEQVAVHEIPTSVVTYRGEHER